MDLVHLAHGANDFLYSDSISSTTSSPCWHSNDSVWPVLVVSSNPLSVTFHDLKMYSVRFNVSVSTAYNWAPSAAVEVTCSSTALPSHFALKRAAAFNCSSAICVPFIFFVNSRQIMASR